MEQLRLIEPHEKYREGFEFFYSNFMNSGEELVPFTLKYDISDFPKYVKQLLGYSKGLGVPEGWVEHSTFWLVNQSDDVLGVINIRHRLTEELKKEGGNIGYGVAPIFRRKGYATEMLKLGLEKAQLLGIEKALVTCDKGNIASAKTILKNGGVFDYESEFNGRMVQKYWIKNH